MYRNLAKAAVPLYLGMLISDKTQQIVVNNTEVDPSNRVLRVSCMLLGNGVAFRTKPYTDLAVDRVADWIIEERAKKDPAARVQ